MTRHRFVASSLAGLLILAAATITPLAAQSTGRLVGRVVDAQTGAGLTNVTIEVVGTGIGTLSGVDGRYVLPRVPAGIVALQAQTIGYAPKTLTQLEVTAGTVTEQNITLAAAALTLTAIEVSAAAERGSVSRALDMQRTATGVVNSITAEQMARSPDGDAASALQRVSGVTVQDGRYVFVRGLGERYTTTSLNGARIPSPEPERRVVPLDLFPSALLQSITTAKSFTPDLPGDFSGAQVDIRTREFPAERQFTLSLSGGFNDRVTGATILAAPATGSEWLGSAGSARALAAPIAAAGDFTGAVSQEQFNAMVNAIRNVWSPRRQTGRGSSATGISLGGTDALFGHDFSYLLSGTYSYGEEVRADEVRARAGIGADGAAEVVDRFSGATGRTTVMWGGLANLSTLLGQRTRVFLNSTFNRTADNEARAELGTSENHGGIPVQIQRLRFVARTVHSMQLGAEHQLGRHALDWSATYSGVRRHEPDRSEFVYARTVAGEPFRWFAASNEGAVRTFGDLSEHNIEAALNYRIALDERGSVAAQAGVQVRHSERDASNRAFSITARQLPVAALELAPEQLFDGRFTADGHRYMRITPLSQGGSYTAADRLFAAYAMLDVGVSDHIRVIGGARVERSELDVTAQSTIGAEQYRTRPEYTDVLPSLALNIRVSTTQNLRLSVSQTLARPEYRELANVQYREVLGGENVIGNPQLQRSLIRNADMRWEWYPARGEVLSLGLFAKRFHDPIERVYLATSGTSVTTFINAAGADNFGVELEARKRLGFLTDALEPLTVFTNATVMDSRIDIATSTTSQTSRERSMVGQAPYVLNAGVTYQPELSGTSATLLYNVVGRRIAGAGEVPMPDIYEQERHVLDISLRAALTGSVAVKFDARNLFDAPYEMRQADVIRETYRAGRTYSFGLSLRR